MTPYPDLLPLRGGTRAEDVAALFRAMRHVLDGTERRVLLPHDPAEDGHAVVQQAHDRLRLPLPPEAAVILRTSGSATGSGRLVALGAAALRAGAQATAERLHGPGRWVLAVPAHHVAGLQLLVRSAVAGTDPVVLGGGFDPAALARAVAGLGRDRPGYLSLVPTQLVRALAAGEEVIAPLRSLAAILVGGAATAPDVLDEARRAGLAVHTTYGMTETGGGCVYDGLPLPGVRLRLGAGGRVEIAGPVLAAGYADDGPDPFVTDEGTRWLRTGDRGALTEGRLRILGRLDDVIVTGGVKVSPAAVEEVLAGHPGVREAAVVGIPDPHWGEAVTAVVVPSGPDRPALAELRDLVGGRLGRPHAPRALVAVPSLPLRGPGKTDRREVARLAAERFASAEDGERLP